MEEALLAAAESSHCVLATGGPSVGDDVPVVLRERGELLVHGVALRPGGPAGFGRLLGTPVFLLPGNPVACLCAYDFFAGRAIRTMAGLYPGWPHTVVRLPLGGRIVSAPGRTDYVHVRIEEGKVVPLAGRGASILSSPVRAHGFVIVPKDAAGCAEGEVVSVHLYSGA
jgi:molybdopterin molybdotransferase